MHRMLLITGAELLSDRRLHQLVFRYTGSARETRVIVRRIRRAMRRGRIQSCMIQAAPPWEPTSDERRWRVLVSYLDLQPLSATHG
jgi:hypothetical protein